MVMCLWRIISTLFFVHHWETLTDLHRDLTLHTQGITTEDINNNAISFFNVTKDFIKFFPITSIEKNIFSSISSIHYMVQSPFEFYSCRSCHGSIVYILCKDCPARYNTFRNVESVVGACVHLRRKNMRARILSPDFLQQRHFHTTLNDLKSYPFSVCALSSPGLNRVAVPAFVEGNTRANTALR